MMLEMDENGFQFVFSNWDFFKVNELNEIEISISNPTWTESP